MYGSNRFIMAGWMSIAASVIFVVAWAAVFVEDSVDMMEFGDRPINIGLSDFLLLLFAAVSIYVFVSLKSFLYERFSYRNLNIVIWIMVAWHILFYGGAFLIELIIAITVPEFNANNSWVVWVYWIVGVAVFGIIDIILGFMLLRERSRFGTTITIFAVINLILGVVEATVILQVMGLILAPLTYIALAFVFFSKQESLEFV